MSITANAPPTHIPKTALGKDPDIDVQDRFFRDLLRSNYLVWERIGSKLSVTGNVGFYDTDPVEQGSSLTASDTNTPNSGDATTDAIIANLQTRVDELEARLDSSTGVGLFT